MACQMTGSRVAALLHMQQHEHIARCGLCALPPLPPTRAQPRPNSLGLKCTTATIPPSQPALPTAPSRSATPCPAPAPPHRPAAAPAPACPLRCWRSHPGPPSARHKSPEPPEMKGKSIEKHKGPILNASRRVRRPQAPAIAMCAENHVVVTVRTSHCREAHWQQAGLHLQLTLRPRTLMLVMSTRAAICARCSGSAGRCVTRILEILTVCTCMCVQGER